VVVWSASVKKQRSLKYEGADDIVGGTDNYALLYHQG
jgi:hypothetical protein